MLCGPAAYRWPLLETLFGYFNTGRIFHLLPIRLE